MDHADKPKALRAMLAELQRILRSPPPTEETRAVEPLPDALEFLQPPTATDALQALEHLAATIQILDELSDADQDAIDRLFRFVQSHR